MFYSLLKFQLFLEACYHSLISLIRVILRFRYRNTVPQRGAGSEELVILGNGPSLKNSLAGYPRFFSSRHLMAVNQFVLSEEYVVLKPNYYVLLDIGYFTDKTIPRVREIAEKLIDAFIRKTDWPLTLLFPHEARGSKMVQRLTESGKPFDFIFFNRTNVDGLRAFRHWSYRNNLGMPKPQNVLVGCLMLGILMKYPLVYVVGADHTWLENIRIGKDNSLISIEKHFYDKDQTGKPTVKEHPETLKKTRLHDYLYDLVRTFSSYHLIRDFSESSGTLVINASEVSYIDAFERKDLSELS